MKSCSGRCIIRSFIHWLISTLLSQTITSCMHMLECASSRRLTAFLSALCDVSLDSHSTGRYASFTDITVTFQRANDLTPYGVTAHPLFKQECKVATDSHHHGYQLIVKAAICFRLYTAELKGIAWSSPRLALSFATI